MRVSVTVAAAIALMATTAWAQGAPNAQPQQEGRKCSKDRRGGSC